MFRRPADWLADRDRLPTAARAVLGYYARTGVVDLRSLRLKRRVDAAVDAMVADAFEAVESAVAERLGQETVSLAYDTKLLLPARLTLGYLYRRLEGTERARAERLTALVVAALLDGDMRDAITDQEYGDFKFACPVSDADRRAAAETAQEALQTRVTAALDRQPDALREIYEQTVAVSERHQDQDRQFRELMTAATERDRSPDQHQGRDRPTAAVVSDPPPAGDTDEPPAGQSPTPRERIAAEYRHASFDEPPALFDDDLCTLPYFKTQYDRVGVIYHGMIDMYRAAGFSVGDPFQRSIVLAIIGAQIWLDDIDDYAADVAAGQLTPVTAEYLLAADDSTAQAAVVALSTAYLRRAQRQAGKADSTLTGIATEYIYRSGDRSVLPA